PSAGPLRRSAHPARTRRAARATSSVNVMASKNVFKSRRGKLVPQAVTSNRAGGRAYRLSPKQALAQYAATGCISTTFYATEGQQLAESIALAYENEARFVAQTAIWAREKSFMKD